MPRKRIYHALPNITGDSCLGVFNNTLDAACVALTERYLNLKVEGILTKPIRPRLKIFDGVLIQKFAKFIVRNCVPTAHVYSRQEVVEMYTGPKRLLYQKAADSLVHNPLEKRDSDLKTFVKFEKINILKAPRLINPRSTRYTLELARYLKKLEKPVYQAIHKYTRSCADYTIIKGLNVVESATQLRKKWDRFEDPVAIGGDITKLDMHISVPALEFEHSVYNRIFRSRKLKNLCRKQLFNTGRAYFKDGSVSFAMKGTRSSGDINTSVGNVIIVCAVIISWLEAVNIEYELADNGDDFVLLTERANERLICELLPKHFYHHGFIVEMEKPVYEFEKLEFCQTKPVFDGVEWRMCRLPRTVFSKDTICTIPINTKTIWRKWLRAVGDCGYHLTAGLPVLTSFYRMYQRAGVAYDAKFFQQVFKGTSAFQSLHELGKFNEKITPEARLSFSRAFKVLPDVQMELERYFDSVIITADFEMMCDAIRDNNLLFPSFQL